MRVTRKTLRSHIRKHGLSKVLTGETSAEEPLEGVLGEGFHGKTYRLDPNLKGETLSSLFENKAIAKIKVYTDEHSEEIYLTERHDITEFLNFLKSRKGVIAKVFKSVFLLTGVTKQQDFEDELMINRKILKYYGPKAHMFLTIAPVKGFRTHKVVGCYIELIKGETLYMVFGSECYNKYSMNIHKMAVDILESLVVLQESSYQHNDIKLDNIVRCDGRYKLIDWGQASSIEEFKFGEIMCTSPIKWYIKGLPRYFSQYLMDYRASMLNSPFEKSTIFEEKNRQIIAEFNEIISAGPDRQELHNKYKRNLDVFMLGMTLLHAVFKFNLKYERYQVLINKMTSLTHPWSSAREALNYTNNHLKKIQQSRKTRSKN